MDFLTIILSLIFLVLLSIVKELYLIRIEMIKQTDKSNENLANYSDKLEDKLNEIIVAVQVSSSKN